MPAIGTITGQTFRGTKRAVPEITIYRHAGKPIDVTPYVEAFQSSDTIDASPGFWSIKLKRRLSVGLEPLSARNAASFAGSIDWRDEVRDNDWLIASFSVPGKDGAPKSTRVVIGLVDTVERERSADFNGAQDVEWTISGQGWAKAIYDTEAIHLPQVSNGPFDIARDIPAVRGAINKALEKLMKQAPGAVVSLIFEFMLRLGEHRGPVPYMEVPASLPLPVVGRNPLAPGQARQIGDVISIEDVDQALDGLLVPSDLIASMEANGARLHDMMRRFTNEPYNEFFFDLAPYTTQSEGAGGVLQAVGHKTLVPAVVLRERPFPVHEGVVTGRPAWRTPSQRWADLPTHEIHERDLIVESLSRSGQERFNFFVALWSHGYGLDRASLTYGLMDGAKLTSAPAIDMPSVRRHGFRKLEIESMYLQDGAESVIVARRWTHMLRDWFGMNHLFLAGTVRVGFMLPEARVGHRLRIRRDDGGYVLAYIEGVDHSWTKGATGTTESRTTFTLTRGTVDRDFLLPDLAGGNL